MTDPRFSAILTELSDSLGMNDPVHEFPLWPIVLSVLGPGMLVSAIARHDSLGVYAAGAVVTLIGWSQLVHWLQRHR
jgi:hypothetical protein